MYNYLEPIQVGVGAFFILALLLIIPYLAFQYRRRGGVGSWHTLVTFSFLLYILCAYALTIFPLPSLEAVRNMTGPTENLKPFVFIEEFREYNPLVPSDPSSWLPALKSSTFYEPAFNILLTLPFGFYLSYLFRKRPLKTVAYSFLLSLSFELIQRSALFGLYPRPYRLFDVDDLLLNTLGGLLGYGLARLVAPTLPALDRTNFDRSRVTMTRRLTAFVLDLLLMALISFFFRVKGVYLLAGYLLSILLFRRSPGGAVVRISVEPGGVFRLLARVLLEAASLAPFIGILIRMQLLSADFILDPAKVYMGLFLNVAALLVELLDFIFAITNGSKRLWYERLSHTRLVGK